MGRKHRNRDGVGAPAQWLCAACQKISLRERKDAKRYARQLRQQYDGVLTIDAYRCPIDETRWHVGHDRHTRRNGQDPYAR